MLSCEVFALFFCEAVTMPSECITEVPMPDLIAEMDANCSMLDTSSATTPPSVYIMLSVMLSDAVQTPPPINVSASHFELLHLVGEGLALLVLYREILICIGAFGKVLTVRSLLDKQIYAMKVSLLSTRFMAIM